MSLRDALRRFLTGERSDWSEKGLRRPMAELERQHGSAAAAARAAGVNKGTWWRWKTGRSKPRPENRAKITRAQRQAKVPRDKQQAMVDAATPGLGAGMRVTATFTISADERGRSINFGAHPMIDDVRAAYMLGDDDAVNAGLQTIIDDTIGSPVGVDGPEIEFY